MTCASFFSFSRSSSTEATITPAFRFAGSTTSKICRSEATSTPSCSGVTWLMGFFFAFMMFGKVAYRGWFNRKSALQSSSTQSKEIIKPEPNQKSTVALWFWSYWGTWVSNIVVMQDEDVNIHVFEFVFFLAESTVRFQVIQHLLLVHEYVRYERYNSRQFELHTLQPTIHFPLHNHWTRVCFHWHLHSKQLLSVRTVTYSLKLRMLEYGHNRSFDAFFRLLRLLASNVANSSYILMTLQLKSSLESKITYPLVMKRSITYEALTMKTIETAI